jgi:hypothetical protein
MNFNTQFAGYSEWGALVYDTEKLTVYPTVKEKEKKSETRVCMGPICKSLVSHNIEDMYFVKASSINYYCEDCKNAYKGHYKLEKWRKENE